ncbi:uncharacterized protein LOC124806540 [Hydra vulgaris]|uniref:uncharacterized protein LOC124806540 n=1 Tax=Hydra vulgaris TaxID=6087 RepID=UPI001F5E9372|nr:uncharacterized protein LOC124806540 [Hydra vulgaris]
MLNLLFVITATSFVVFIKGICDSNNGPAGSKDCILADPNYTKYQWATCLTNDYIRQKSSGKHKCQDGQGIYCYYQCMIELYNLDHGPVYDNCACEDNSESTLSPMSTLPPSCYSPTGADCSWYSNCLAAKFPCSGSQTEYAISYGQKFCSLYNDRRSAFSQNALNWVNAVRKCLQVSLVPLLRDYSTVSCNDIFNKAMASHPGCYVSPYQGLSVCTLSPTDWWQIFWTIKGAFKDQFVETLSQSLDTALGCVKDVWWPKSKNSFSNFWLKLKLFYTNRRKRSTATDKSNNETAFQILEKIYEQLNWNKYSIDWYTYTTNSSFNNDEWSVLLLLADTNALGFTNKTTKLNIADAINALSDSIQKGSLQINLPGNTGVVFVGQTLENCLQFVEGSCLASQTLATLPINFTLNTFTTMQPTISSSASVMFLMGTNMLVLFTCTYHFMVNFALK